MINLNPDTVFAWHGDFPVFADSRPINNLSGFVTRAQTLADGTRCDPEPNHLKHAITVDEALETMTIGAAFALDRETEVGSIETGKLADLVVLSADPREVPSEDLIALSVDLTILDGEPVYCGDVYAPLCGETVAEGEASASASASASLPSNPPAFAVDGDLETHWGSGAGAPQWIEVDLGAEQEVAMVRLVVDQFPPGPTQHVIWGRTADDELVQLAEVDGDTDMFDVLEVEIGEPIPVVAIRVETVESPSWVAWREIEIVTG